MENKNADGNTPLHRACFLGNLEKVQKMIVNHNLNEENKDGDTPLHFASYRGHLEIVKTLIEAGADIDTKNKTGNTPLHLASQEAHLNIVKALIHAGTNYMLINKNGYLASEIAKGMSAHDKNKHDTYMEICNILEKKKGNNNAYWSKITNASGVRGPWKLPHGGRRLSRKRKTTVKCLN